MSYIHHSKLDFCAVRGKLLYELYPTNKSTKQEFSNTQDVEGWGVVQRHSIEVPLCMGLWGNASSMDYFVCRFFRRYV